MRARTVLVMAAMALALAAAPLGAMTAASSGQPGVHVLIDSVTWPGASCNFPDPIGHDFPNRVTVRAPVVYAYDATSHVDSQVVGWWFRVQYLVSGNTWHDLAGSKSHLVKAKATDAYNAQWAPQHLPLPGDHHPFYRVVLSVRWYAPNGTTIVGRATMKPTYYLQTGPGFSDVEPYCEGSLG